MLLGDAQEKCMRNIYWTMAGPSKPGMENAIAQRNPRWEGNACTEKNVSPLELSTRFSANAATCAILGRPNESLKGDVKSTSYCKVGELWSKKKRALEKLNDLFPETDDITPPIQREDDSSRVSTRSMTRRRQAQPQNRTPAPGTPNSNNGHGAIDHPLMEQQLIFHPQSMKRVMETMLQSSQQHNQLT